MLEEIKQFISAEGRANILIFHHPLSPECKKEAAAKLSILRDLKRFIENLENKK